MISATVLTKNSAKHLPEVLEALKPFDEVLVFDNGSKDNTIAIAKSFSNCRVVEGTFTGFGPTHNTASNHAKHSWIFSVDSDEVPSKELVEEILALPLDASCVYSCPRHNIFNGKWIHSCGWHPDRVFRLYNKEKTRFTDALVHETIETKGMKTAELKGYLKHYSYDSLSDFLSKMQSYSTLFAEQQAGKKKASPFSAIGHGMAAFFKSYVLKKGFTQGYEGFVISVYNGHTAFWKYMKLYEINSRRILR